MKTNQSLNKALKKIIAKTHSELARVYSINLSRSKTRSDRYHLYINRETSAHYYYLGGRGKILSVEVA